MTTFVGMAVPSVTTVDQDCISGHVKELSAIAEQPRHMASLTSPIATLPLPFLPTRPRPHGCVQMLPPASPPQFTQRRRSIQ